MAASGVLNTTGYQGRYLQFSWSIKNSEQDRIETNKTTIAWTLKGAGDAVSAYYETGNITLVIDGVTAYTRAKFDRIKLYSGTQVANGEITFTHDNNGKKSFNVSLEAGIYLADVNCSGSGSFVVDDIPRASTLVAYNGQLAQEHTVTIRPASPTFKHRLTYHCADVVDYIAGSPTTYYTGDPAVKWTPPIGLAAENTTGTSVVVKYTLYTYTNSGTHVGTTTLSINCAIPASVAPSCSISLVKDVSGALDVYGQPVQGISKLELVINGRTSQGANIVAYSLTVNGVKYDEQTITTDVLTKSGQTDISATVKDQRGRTGSARLTQPVLAYAPPIVSALSVSRYNANNVQDNEGGTCRITFSAAVTNLVGKNPPVYTVEYKKSTDPDYTLIDTSDLAGVYTVPDKRYDFAADPNATYDVRVIVADNHAQDSRTTSLSTAFTLMNWNAAGNGMGIGKVSEREYAVEFGMDLYDKNGDRILGVSDLVNLFFPVGTIVTRYDHKDPATIYGGTWTRISSYLLRGALAGGTIGETVTLADGSGRTAINVSIWRRTA